jgi:hypothetical protein
LARRRWDGVPASAHQDAAMTESVTFSILRLSVLQGTHLRGFFPGDELDRAQP